MYNLVLLRHGQSEWNKENRFTGWRDIDLSEKGKDEARTAGKKIKSAGITFDLAFSSILIRANHTLDLALEEIGQTTLETKNAWQLNERHYGALQGMNKDEVRQKYGDAEFLAWRRGYNTPPPPASREEIEENYETLKDWGINEEDVPETESLKDVYQRIVPFWELVVLPELKNGKKIFISAHGNSLRALVKHLEKISDPEIANLEIPTGAPLAYEISEAGEIVSKKYL